MSQIRTRYAPSPTGYQHVGNIRTALFAWLVARQGRGKFIVRLEDTDRARLVEGADKHLLECLDTLGLDHDEGFDINGPYGPYRQSERLEIYKSWAIKLIESGRAYADPYSQEEVQEFREEAKKNKTPFLYRNHRPNNPPSWDGTQPLRFKSEPKNYKWHDEVMGDLSTGPEVIDDFIIMKSDGYPTYNFAHIIDDMSMKITHIIRGQEFISSTPNYLNLYEALNIDVPVMATVPHILAETGNKKLGKRDGAKDVLDYIREGFLPEALVSFIATLGWNDGSTQELFTKNELITKFSLDRVQKSGARFDEQRLKWINGSLIRDMDINDLYGYSLIYWPELSSDYDDKFKIRVLSLIQERLKYLSEIPELTKFFFCEPDINIDLIKNHKQLKKIDPDQLKDLLELSKSKLDKSNFNELDLTDKLNELLEENGQKPAVIFSLIRIVTTWSPSSPGLAESLSVLGKEKTIDRIEKAIDYLS
jgi:glutamyl-tRNA synthetase